MTTVLTVSAAPLNGWNTPIPDKMNCKSQDWHDGGNGQGQGGYVETPLTDADLYTQIKTVTTHSDILRVYTNLQNASLNNHLTAFQTYD